MRMCVNKMIDFESIVFVAYFFLLNVFLCKIPTSKWLKYFDNGVTFQR